MVEQILNILEDFERKKRRLSPQKQRWY